MESASGWSGTSGKDGWDKLEIIARLISGIGLVALPIILGIKSDEIARAFRSGEFTQVLITDLAQPDTSLRQEIALVALDRAVGDQNDALVVEVCEEIFRNTRDFNTRSGMLAYRIIRRRNPVLADSLDREIGRAAASRQASLISSPDTAVALPAAAPETTELIARTFSNVVFIQYRNPGRTASVRVLQERLTKAGFTAPGIELVEKRYGNSVRYFHEEDRLLAERVAEITAAFLREQGLSATPQLQALPQLRARVTRGQIEVWLNFEQEVLLRPQQNE